MEIDSVLHVDHNGVGPIPYNESKHNIQGYQGMANKSPFTCKTLSLREGKSCLGRVLDFFMTAQIEFF
jgi:hypothetical protein